MPERLGPRACTVCPPGRIAPCYRCGMKVGHRHLDVIDRHGHAVGRVAACDTHAPSAGPGSSAVASGAPARSEALPSDVDREAKRQRDRERRQAQRIVLDRHADEVAQVLAEVRHG